MCEYTENVFIHFLINLPFFLILIAFVLRSRYVSYIKQYKALGNDTHLERSVLGGKPKTY